MPATGICRRILKVCKEVGIAAVECRTTHKHGVEPTLTAGQRKDVKKQFADSGVVFWGCGSVCEFHSDRSAVVKKNIEECKQFVDLVKDIGGKGVKVRPNGVPKGARPAEDIRADRQGAHRVRQGGRAMPASRSGSRCTERSRRCRRTCGRSWTLAGTSPSA